jgi:hypothetical protein
MASNLTEQEWSPLTAEVAELANSIRHLERSQVEIKEVRMTL